MANTSSTAAAIAAGHNQMAAQSCDTVPSAAVVA
jgi:hypothetical protein